jgi:selenide, water dikinase
MNYESVGGCTSKVDAAKLVGLLRDAGLPVRSVGDFGDAYVIPSPAAAVGLAMSVDLIYDPGLPPFDFGWISAVHAMSDIFASLAMPSYATVCLGVTRAQLESGHASEVLRGVASGLECGGASLAGGHTIYAERPFVAVAPVGVQANEAQAKVQGSSAYELWLSKPIGNGILLAAHREGLKTIGPDDIAVRLMKTTSAASASTLKDLHLATGDLGFSTDVSGFGLVGAILSKVPPGWCATLHAAAVPMLEDTERLIANHAIITNLGEENMFFAKDSGQCETSAVSTSELLALCDPQTSGGLLAAIRPASAHRLREDKVSDWTLIGDLEQRREGAQGPNVFKLVVR